MFSFTNAQGKIYKGNSTYSSYLIGIFYDGKVY